tara:strand:+ start:2957 stop:3742 length:786 start_codon:yes stop_codon:yes gene_type:complete
MNADAMQRLKTTDLTCGYQRNIILSKLNINIQPGKITALIGPNGCGKSTLLKTMARVQKPKSGTVELDGKNIFQQSSKSIAKQLTMLPQAPITPEGIKVKELVAYGRSPHLNQFGKINALDQKIISQSMMMTAVDGLADRPVDQLSGGQRQRAWIAMILAQQTDILFLDEPTSFLDLTHQYELLDCLRQLNQQGRTIVVVLHDLNQACRYSDHLIVLNQGKIVAEGPPKAVFTEELLNQHFDLKAIVMDDPITGTPMCVVR